jgi:hypothetical protein
VLDGEVIEIDSVVNGKCNNGGTIISEDSRNTEVQGLRITMLVASVPKMIDRRWVPIIQGFVAAQIAMTQVVMTEYK